MVFTRLQFEMYFTVLMYGLQNQLSIRDCGLTCDVTVFLCPVSKIKFSFFKDDSKAFELVFFCVFLFAFYN